MTTEQEIQLELATKKYVAEYIKTLRTIPNTRFSKEPELTILVAAFREGFKKGWTEKK